MSTHELDHLLYKVREHATKARELTHKIEKAPLHEVVVATKSLKTEIETLLTMANKAISVRR